jgi:DNA-binding NarL/FixJ family response regulator
MPASSKSRALPRTWSALSPSTRALGLAAALHGEPLRTSWLELLGISDADVDAALTHGLLQETDAGLVLASTFDAVALSATASWSQRRRLHQALARACLQPPARTEHAARHFEAGGQPGEAARAYLAAGEQSRRRHRHQAAVRAYSSGLRLLPPDATDAETLAAIEGLERCAGLGRDTANTIALLNDWRLTPPWRDRPEIRARTALALAALLSQGARHVESAQLRREASRDLALLGRPAEAASAALAAATTLAFALQFTPARDAIADAARIADVTDDPALTAQVATLNGLILGMSGQTAAGRKEVERALGIALAHRLTSLAAEAYRLLGTVAEYASCYRDEQAAFSSAIAYCRRHDESATAGLCLGCLSYSFFRSGNWKRCEETVRRIRADRKVHPVSRLVADGVFGLLQAHRGETRQATQLLQNSLEQGRLAGLVSMDLFNHLGLAVVAETQGQTDIAADCYRRLFDTWRSTEDTHDAIPGLACAVTFFAVQGHREEAAEIAEALETIASATANPEAAGAAMAAAAEIHLLEGENAEAVKRLRNALAAYEQRDLSVELIRVRIRLGHALRQTGAAGEARTILAEAVRHARRLGARPLAASAEAGMNEATYSRSGDAGRKNGVWDLLSARQREVGRHLARGLANKEIAAQLGLSVRTVEMHVADVLSRLDCRSRTHAAARIAAELS